MEYLNYFVFIYKSLFIPKMIDIETLKYFIMSI